MNDRVNGKLKNNAQELRKNMTPEEKRLWFEFLKTLPMTINRQKPIGKYIVDFYCAQAKLVIEIDGSQHYEESGAEKDKLRDEYMRGLGLTVLRYTNLDIKLRFASVCEDIYHRLNL